MMRAEIKDHVQATAAFRYGGCAVDADRAARRIPQVRRERRQERTFFGAGSCRISGGSRGKYRRQRSLGMCARRCERHRHDLEIGVEVAPVLLQEDEATPEKIAALLRPGGFRPYRSETVYDASAY
jgi:hypothetical protein